MLSGLRELRKNSLSIFSLRAARPVEQRFSLIIDLPHIFRLLIITLRLIICCEP